jgi:DNA-directed RNA polymerase specialized sigma24 family protein
MDEPQSFQWPDDLERILPEVFRFIIGYGQRKWGIDFNTAEEIAQVVCGRLWAKREDVCFQGWPPLREYILFMARTAFREEREGRSHRGRLEYVENLTTFLKADDETGISLDECLSWLLNASEREAVRLKVVEDIGIVETAKRLGLRVTTAHNRLKDGLAKIKARLSELLDRSLPDEHKAEC